MWRRAFAGGFLVAVAVLGTACESNEQKAVKRSNELLQQFKQRSFPGLPDSLTTEQAVALDQARNGPGKWFVETGCFACHSVSAYGVKSPSQMGPDLSLAQEDVEKRFGRHLEDFWHEPNGTMTMVRSQLIKLSPEEEAIGLKMLKDAYAEHQKQGGASK
jgi:hypothetical protein